MPAAGLGHTRPMDPVILLPGLACDAGLWRHQHGAIAKRGPVFVSDVHTRHDTIPAMAEALLSEHAGPLVLVGSSMGGMIAIEAALRAPSRMRGLALLCTSARADTPEQIRLRSDAIVLFEQGRADDVLRTNITFAFHPERAADPVLVGEYFDLIRRAGTAQLVRQNRAVMARRDLRPALGAITCPTLVLSGLADGLAPPECSREIAAALPDARLVEWADCGHLPMLEAPARTTALLLDWLAALRRPMP
jgi:pimeloyl-ACP methyl ester carboxylesterase